MNKKIIIVIAALFALITLNGCTSTNTNTPNTNTTIPENEIYYAGATKHSYMTDSAGHGTYCYYFYFNYYYTEPLNLDYRYTRLATGKKDETLYVSHTYNGIYYDPYSSTIREPSIIVPCSTLTAVYTLIDTEDTDVSHPKIDMDLVIHVELVRLVDQRNTSQQKMITLKSKDFKVGDLMSDLISHATYDY